MRVWWSEGSSLQRKLFWGGGDPIVKLLDKVYYTIIVKGKKRILIVVRIKLSLIEQREIDE